MGFDPEEARRRILPTHDARARRDREMLDAIDGAIGHAHHEIARREYANGGTVMIGDDAAPPASPIVAWQFGEIALLIDDSPVWVQYFIDEKGDLAVDQWGRSAGPVVPDGKRVRRVFRRGGNTTGNDSIAPRYTYPPLLLTLLDEFTHGAGVATIESAAEQQLWRDYGMRHGA